MSNKMQESTAIVAQQLRTSEDENQNKLTMNEETHNNNDEDKAMIQQVFT